MGVEEFLVSFYTEPELIRDMMKHFTDIWLRVYEKINEKVKIHCIHIWEDMSFNQGPLISPALVREFMMPHYARIADFAKRKGIEIFSVDSDGDVSKLIPLFMDAGINLILPFEVHAGSDILEIGKRYPELVILGGIEKSVIGGSRRDIDTELARIEPMLRRGRYFPALDHAIPPEVSYANICYFFDRLKEMIYKFS